MAIKFQYNKTSLGELDKQLKMRKKALPTIKSKESALRSEVKRAREMARDFHTRMEALIERYDYMKELWCEFDPSLVRIKDVELREQKIAGVRSPILERVIFEPVSYNAFSSPIWFSDGVEILKGVAELALEFEIYNRKMELLDYARRKTTQKVNLYEKVQIPGYEDAILKIKRFMEDEENLDKSSQKIVKSRQQAAAQEGASV